MLAKAKLGFKTVHWNSDLRYNSTILRKQLECSGAISAVSTVSAFPATGSKRRFTIQIKDAEDVFRILVATLCFVLLTDTST